MNTLLTWYEASRKELPGLVIGVERPSGSPRPTPELLKSDFAVGYERRADGTAILGSPLSVVVDDHQTRELLAWVHTYASETFPISQFARIQNLSDWKLLSQTDPSEGSDAQLSQTVSSLIVGEMLAQADSGLDLAAVPLSWANGCFTLAMYQPLSARGGMRDQLTKLVCDRLRACEIDPRFATRQIRVAALTPMWALVGQDALADTGLTSVCGAVVSALSPLAAQMLLSNDGLLSSSAEDRVRGFDGLVDQAMALGHGDNAAKSSASCLVAAAALLVGRSTSHLELLSPLQADMPESLLWFGLMAGAAGPQAWDSGWLRLVKGVERQLRSLALSAQSGADADLTWLEYEWLSNQPGLDSVFGGFPKRHARTLSVEMLPGAPCQFRLQPSKVSRGARSDIRPALTTKLPTLPSGETLMPAAESSWGTIRRAAGELERLLAAALQEAEPAPQPSLFDADERPQVKRPSKARAKISGRK